MKKITIQQVKNGWSVTVASEAPQTASSMQSMINNMVHNMTKAAEEDPLLRSLREDKTGGVYVFVSYGEVLDFLATIEDRR